MTDWVFDVIIILLQILWGIALWLAHKRAEIWKLMYMDESMRHALTLKRCTEIER